MEHFWWLYLATRLDSLQIAFGWMIAIFAITSLLIIVILGISYDDEYNQEKEEKMRVKTRPWRNWSIGLFFLSVFCLALTPSKKDVLFIAGGVGVIEASKAIAGSEIAKKSVAIVEQWLANNLEEMKQDNSKKIEKGK